MSTPHKIPVESPSSFGSPEISKPTPSTEIEQTSEKESALGMQTAEEKEGFLDETLDGMKKILKRSNKKIPSQIPQVRDKFTVEIEHIMAEGLEEAYRELPIIEQQKFKIKGEETALKIRQLLKATHLKVKKIFRLLLDWLRMLPGINRFFLEQEAKIKADKIIALKEIARNKN
jgi:hypothetical protein